MQTPASNSALIVGPYVNFQSWIREAMELYRFGIHWTVNISEA